MQSFSELGLGPQILRALALEGHTSPTPIQTQAIPFVIAGRDLTGIAQTGTGKTAAFALPILDRLAASAKSNAKAKTCRTLVLSPTRELAQQIRDRFDSYGRFLSCRTAIAVGGVPIGKQRRALAEGTDILIATPGRLIDLMETGAVDLSAVEILVLDEADRMLDMGFIHPIKRIVAKLPETRQTLLFSATMPKAIADLAKSFLRDPATAAATPVAKTADRVEQRVVFVPSGAKLPELQHLLAGDSVDRTLIFVRTKRGADRIVRALAKASVPAQAIHGDKSQPQRERALEAFRNGTNRVLIATDIAARGIDVANITHVINYDLPNEPESYVHRIGRTARAGAGGIAISLCTSEERPHLAAIEKLIKQHIPEMDASGAPAAGERQRANAPGRPVKATGIRKPRRRGKTNGSVPEWVRRTRQKARSAGKAAHVG